MKALLEHADALVLNVDPDPPELSMWDAVNVERNSIYQRTAWLEGADKQVQDAVLLVLGTQMATAIDWNSALFKTKLNALVLYPDVRAHEGGAYERVRGTWRALTAFSAAHITRMETAYKGAISMVMSGDEGAAASNAHGAGLLESYVHRRAAEDGASAFTGYSSSIDAALD